MTIGLFLTYTAIWIGLLLFFFGGNFALLFLSGQVDKRNQGGPVDRLCARKARETEQYVQGEGLTVAFGVLIFGGIIWILFLLNLFTDKETAASIVVNLLLYGTIAFFCLSPIVIIAVIIWAIVSHCNEQEKQRKRLELARKQYHEVKAEEEKKEKAKQESAKQKVEYEEEELDDWD